MKINIKIFLVILILSKATYGQSLKPKEIKKLNNLGLNYDLLGDSIVQPPVYADFKNILRENRKRKRKKTAGFVLGGIGAVSLAGSIALLNTKTSYPGSDEKAPSLGGLLGGGVTMLFSASCLTTSITLFAGSHRAKKKRDKLLQQYQVQPTIPFEPNVVTNQ
jgi:hypothetical protein